MAITLRQVETFRAVMDTGSMTRAAELLGVSQPTVSRLIADMEAEIGLVLFERGGRVVQPTPEALAIGEEVERSFAGLAQIDAMARSLSVAPRLKITVVPSLVPVLADTVLAGFARVRPNVTVSLDVQTTRRTLEDIVSRQADLGITFEPVNDPAFTVTVIGHAEAACVIPARHRLAGDAGPVAIAQLQGEPFVAFMPDALFRQRLDRMLGLAGIQVRVRAEARTTEAACRMAAALPAITVVPSGRVDVGEGRLVVRPLAPAIVSDVVVALPAGRPPSGVASDFLTFVAELGPAALDTASRRTP
ncbi:MAG: LysR family transcriptional regulator [Alsobacter sp.]